MVGDKEAVTSPVNSDSDGVLAMEKLYQVKGDETAGMQVNPMITTRE